MPSIRNLTPAARLQLEIMCQMHTTDIQPISFMSKLGGGGADADYGQQQQPNNATPTKPKRPKSGRTRVKQRPKSAGAVAAGHDGDFGSSARYYLHQAEQTRKEGGQVVEGCASRTHRRRNVQEKGFGEGERERERDGEEKKNELMKQPSNPSQPATFVPDAEYLAQMVRLESLLGSKQKKKFLVEDGEKKKEKVETRRGQEKMEKKKKEKKKHDKLTDLGTAMLAKYKIERSEMKAEWGKIKKMQQEEIKELVKSRRDEYNDTRHKVERDKQEAIENRNMKALTDTMETVQLVNTSKKEKEKEEEEEEEEVKEEEEEEGNLKGSEGGGGGSGSATGKGKGKKKITKINSSEAGKKRRGSKPRNEQLFGLRIGALNREGMHLAREITKAFERQTKRTLVVKMQNHGFKRLAAQKVQAENESEKKRREQLRIEQEMEKNEEEERERRSPQYKIE